MLADNASQPGGGGYVSPVATYANKNGLGAAVPNPEAAKSSDPSLDFSMSPYAGVYGQYALQAKQLYDKALTSTQLKRGNLYNQAGFKASYNPDGSVSNLDVDGSNLTGDYQQLQRGQGQALEANHEAAMARHIGGAGIAAQPESNLRYGNAVQQGGFMTGLMNQDLALEDNNSNAYGSYKNTLMNLQMQAISDALSSGNLPAAPGSGGGKRQQGGQDNSAIAPSNVEYAQSPVGQQMVQKIVNPSSGAAQTLLAAAQGKTVPNYQANKNAAGERFATPSPAKKTKKK